MISLGITDIVYPPPPPLSSAMPAGSPMPIVAEVTFCVRPAVHAALKTTTRSVQDSLCLLPSVKPMPEPWCVGGRVVYILPTFTDFGSLEENDCSVNYV